MTPTYNTALITAEKVLCPECYWDGNSQASMVASCCDHTHSHVVDTWGHAVGTYGHTMGMAEHYVTEMFQAGLFKKLLPFA